MKIEILKVGILETNCYILIGKKKIVVIDPGSEAKKIINKIEDFKEEDTVVEIVNTHYHYDHTLANEELRDYFNAKILIHENEKIFVNFKPDIFLKDGDTIGVNGTKLKVLNTPGHSKGGICLIGDEVAFVGDTIFAQGIGRTDLPGGNMDEMKKSLKKVAKSFNEGMHIYPGHGDNFIWKNDEELCA
jgi:hydroxyacylglutathione hydrolase